MIRRYLLNSDINRVVSQMGHTDSLCIGDAGLPVPESTERIDLALRAGVPGFIDVLETVLEELCIEKIILAEEIKEKNPGTMKKIEKILAAYTKESGYKVETIFVSHEELKRTTRQTKALIRTGEVSPYANVILYSGVVF